MKSKKIEGDNVRKEQTFYENGQIESEVTYIGEDIEGTSRQWHKNGILKEETPMKQSKIHGVMRSWDCQGNLLDESRFKNGSGVFRNWTANGQLTGETHLHEGIPHGRLRAWDEEGELLVEQYFIFGRQVSKKAYFKASETDATLPDFSKDDGQKPVLTTLMSSVPPTECFHKTLADFPDAQEALEWLGNSTAKNPRTLGELSSIEESVDLVKEFVEKGASTVYVVNVVEDDDGSLNSGQLLVGLPPKSRKRGSVLGMANELNESCGFSKEGDTGQHFVLVALD